MLWWLLFRRQGLEWRVQSGDTAVMMRMSFCPDRAGRVPVERERGVTLDSSPLVKETKRKRGLG